MKEHNPRPFHETLIGFVLVGVLIAMISWGIQRAIDRHGSTPPVTDSSLPTTAAPQPQNPVPSLQPSQAPPAPMPAPAPSPAPAAQATASTAPHGKFAYSRQVGGFGRSRVNLSTGQFYTVPLTLETVENDPSTSLSLHFLFENKEDNEYQFHLVRPSETALVVDSANVEYSFLAASEIDSPGGLTVPPFSRRRFVVSFQPINVPSDSLRVDLVFQQESMKGSYLPERPKRVQITNIPLYYLTH